MFVLFFLYEIRILYKMLENRFLGDIRVVGFSLELKWKFTSFFEMKYVKNGNLTIHSPSFTSLTVFQFF